MESTYVTSEVDVSELFADFGLTSPVMAKFNEHTYEYDPSFKDNWVFFALKGFQNLQRLIEAEGNAVHTFATIGTGAGLDAIGAQAIFHPKTMILTDVHPDVLSVARENVTPFTNKQEVIFQHGNLCEPLRMMGMQADVIYANLPLIPYSGSNLLDGMNSSSYVSTKAYEHTPEIYKKHLLGIIHTFLKEACFSLKPQGSVVVNLGGRIPVALVQQMFKDCGYFYSELYTGFKLQTQCEDILPGFSNAEKEFGIEFDYYDYEKGSQHPDFVCAKDLKEYLSPHRMSATDALRAFQHGKQVGHVVQVIRGTISQ